jgi:hypothetical protein
MRIALGSRAGKRIAVKFVVTSEVVSSRRRRRSGSRLATVTKRVVWVGVSNFPQLFGTHMIARLLSFVRALATNSTQPPTP